MPRNNKNKTQTKSLFKKIINNKQKFACNNYKRHSLLLTTTYHNLTRKIILMRLILKLKIQLN